MARPTFTFDTVAYGDAHSGGYGRTVDASRPDLDSEYAFRVRVARWNKRAASSRTRSITSWADNLAKAELAAGKVELEEVESERYPGKVRRIYRRGNT